MARDRKRAKQRRERRGAAAARRAAEPSSQAARSASGTPGELAPSGNEAPDPLEHASADVDEFEAALVRGAGGAPAAPDELEAPPADLDAEADLEDGTSLAAEDELAPPPGPPGDGAGGDGGAPGGGPPAGERPSGAPLQGGNRAVAFLRASWAELQRVQWPDRRQVTQATAVVLGFVAIAGAYLGIADFVAKEIVEFVL